MDEEVADLAAEYDDDSTPIHTLETPAATCTVVTLKVLTDFRSNVIKYNHLWHALVFLSCLEPYDLLLPGENQAIFYCPEGCVAFYAKHLDFFLHFPLHPFIVRVPRDWKVCLTQISPIVIRNLVVFIWL